MHITVSSIQKFTGPFQPVAERKCLVIEIKLTRTRQSIGIPSYHSCSLSTELEADEIHSSSLPSSDCDKSDDTWCPITMSSLEAESIGSPQHSKPCIGCRKRKVKCDKTRPCSNCTRLKQLCIYESLNGSEGQTEQTGDNPSSSDNELRERLGRLEIMMAAMMASGQAGDVTGSPNASPFRHSSSPNATPSHSLDLEILPASHPNIEHAPVGQIIFQEGHSAYFDSDFWPGLVNEVSKLKYRRPRCMLIYVD
jgi:hypothetical protein